MTDIKLLLGKYIEITIILNNLIRRLYIMSIKVTQTAKISITSNRHVYYGWNLSKRCAKKNYQNVYRVFMNRKTITPIFCFQFSEKRKLFLLHC